MINDYFADMHTHSHYSDSSVTIFELLQSAGDNGVRALSLTDHDTLQGQASAFQYGRNLGIQVISGIEISAYDFSENKKVHILGYYLDPEDHQVEDFCKPVRQQRHQATEKLHHHFVNQGFRCDWSRVVQLAQPGDSAFRLHLVRAILEELHESMPSATIRLQLEHDYKEVHFPIQYADARAVVSLLKERGSLPVIAHPAHYGNLNNLAPLVDAGLQGIETYHPCHSTDDITSCLEFAKRYNLFISGGSDYHGEYNPTGATPGSCGIRRADFEKLSSRRSTNIV